MARSFRSRAALAAFAALAALCVTLVTPALAHAQSSTCPNTIGGGSEIDSIDETVRARWLQKTLESESSRARLWTWGWVGAGVAGTTVNGVWAATASYSDRVDRIGAASGTMMLTLSTLVDPMKVPSYEGERTARTTSTCNEVVRAERVLAAVAEDEARRQGFLGHAMPIGGSIAGGLVLGIGYGHWASGAINAGIGILISEIKMLTQPMGAPKALGQYRSGLLGSDSPRIGWVVAPTLIGKDGKDGGGLALSLSY